MVDVPSGNAAAEPDEANLDQRAERIYEAVMQGWFNGARPNSAGWGPALWVLCYALAPFPGVLPGVSVRDVMDFTVVYREHTHPSLGWGQLTVGMGHTRPGALTSYVYVEFLGSFRKGQQGPPDPAQSLRDDVLVETSNPLAICLYHSSTGVDTFPISGLRTLEAAKAAGLKLARVLETRFGLEPELPTTAEGE